MIVHRNATMNRKPRTLRPMRTLYRLLLRTVSVDDPWARYEHDVPLHLYGAGARRDFAWYFEGESAVAVATVDEVCAWLQACEYTRDPDLFFESDFWQHPCTFEQLRKGDCEDYALWAWRKLVELGHDAEFVVGRSLQPGGKRRGHAWVHFIRDGELYLLDAATDRATCSLRPLTSVQQEYLPEVSIDHRFQRFAYGGYYLQLRRRQKPQDAP